MNANTVGAPSGMMEPAVERRVVPDQCCGAIIWSPKPCPSPDDVDLVVDVVGHADRAAQRDLLLRVPADHRVLHVEVLEHDRRLDAAHQRERRARRARASACSRGPARCRRDREARGSRWSSSPFWKASSRGFDSSMMLISTRPIAGSFCPSSPRGSAGRRDRCCPGRIVAERGARLQHDLLAADPFLQHVRARAHRIGHRRGCPRRHRPRPPPARPPTSWTR